MLIFTAIIKDDATACIYSNFDVTVCTHSWLESVADGNPVLIDADKERLIVMCKQMGLSIQEEPL